MIVVEMAEGVEFFCYYHRKSGHMKLDCLLWKKHQQETQEFQVAKVYAFQEVVANMVLIKPIENVIESYDLTQSQDKVLQNVVVPQQPQSLNWEVQQETRALALRIIEEEPRNVCPTPSPSTT